MQSQVQIRNNWTYVLHKLFDHPSLVLIGGQWKTGKTDFALYIAETLQKLPFGDSGAEKVVTSVATNIDTTDKAIGKIRYDLIYDLVSLRRWLYSDTKRKLYIFDEVNEHLPSRRAMTGKNVGVIQIIPEISKAHARLLMIGHQLLTVDKTLVDDVWCRGVFIKQGLKTAQLISHLLTEEYVFNNIPPTSIPFDPYAIAPFQEKPPTTMIFKDGDKQLLWDWVHGKNYKDLGIKPMTLHRKVQGYIKAILENELNT